MSPSEPHTPIPIGRSALCVVACLLPLACAAFSPWRADTALVYIGVLPALVALPNGHRVAIGTAGATGGAVLVGLLVSQSAVPAALFLAALAVGVAWSYTRGWHAPATYVATQAGLAAVAAPTVRSIDTTSFGNPLGGNALIVAAIVTAAGIWVAGFGSLTLPPMLRRAAPQHRRDTDLTIYAATLAILLGVTTFVLLAHTSGGNVWWILLTILVSLTPTARQTLRRAAHRAGGTVLGGAVAATVVAGSGSDKNVLITVGFIAAVASAVTYLRAPYWVFSATLTMALVLLTLPTGHRILGGLERVVYTVLAATVVAAVALAVDAARRRIISAGGTRETESPRQDRR